MKAIRSTLWLGALLAVLMATAGPPSVGRANQDERPDLQIEVVGLDPTNPRAVRLRVTNVGRWWADKTTATVEADPPSAGARVTQAVPDLGPKGDKETASQFEFTYPLAAACGGQAVKVKASLKAAATFNGNTEATADLGNNAIPRAGQTGEVCAAAAPKPAAETLKPVPVAEPDPGRNPLVCTPMAHAQGHCRGSNEITLSPGPDPIIEAMGRANEARAAHAQPGTHTLPPLGVARSSPKEMAMTVVDFCGPPQPGRPPVAPPQLQGFLVGWWQTEYDGYACSSHTHEVALLFDSGLLDQVPLKTINRAVLTYDEGESFCVAPALPDGAVGPWVSCWTNGEGEPEPKPQGCVVVAVPTVDWRNGHRGELPNTTTKPDVKRLGPREWDVTEPFAWQLANTAGLQTQDGRTATPGFGFLLRGGLGIGQLEAQDNTRCTSDVSNIRLSVTYTVPAVEDDEPFQPPK